jgi:hypothetical protein
MTVARRTGWLLIGAAVTLAITFLLVPRLPQQASYHQFADGRTLIDGIPNTLDVISNLAFVLPGLLGLASLARGRLVIGVRSERIAIAALFSGMVVTAAGSWFYHLAPDDFRLIFDRAGMCILFAGFFAVMLDDRVLPAAPWTRLIVLEAIGLAGGLSWYLLSDLRFYGWVQFFPFLATAAMLLAFPGRYDRAGRLWIALGWFLVTKGVEAFDAPIFQLLGGTLSGHTLKHLAAGVAMMYLWLWLGSRRLASGRTLYCKFGHDTWRGVAARPPSSNKEFVFRPGG